MKKIVMVLIVMLALLATSGCNEALLVGGGVAGGHALTSTLEGAKKDLEIREQYLIDLYNQGVEDGTSVEELKELKQKIVDTRLTKETVETGDELIGIDWNDSKQVGGAIALVSSLVLAWRNRKKDQQIEARDSAIAKFQGVSAPETASLLHDIVKAKTASTA